MTVAISPPLVALMAWGCREIILNLLSGRTRTQPWVAALILLVLGAMALMLLGALAWAFGSRVIISGGRMTVRGIARTVGVTPEQIEGYRFVDGLLQLHLKGRAWGLQLAYYERQGEIEAWVARRAKDLGREERAREAAEIDRDTRLGFSEQQRDEEMSRLHRWAGALNMAAYASAAAGVLSWLVIKQETFGAAAIGAMVGVPVLLDLFALRHRGHVRIDHTEGSRYPQILSGNLACGLVLALVSLFDRDVLLLGPFLLWFLPALLAKGLMWSFVDGGRLADLFGRSRPAALITAAAMFVIPSFWVGGAVYQANVLLDRSSVAWSQTEVLGKRVSSGRSVRYLVELAPWEGRLKGAIEVEVSGREFAALVEGGPARVGIRRGALDIPWVEAVEAASPTSETRR